MLDIKLIREQSDLVKKGVSAKGYDPDLVDQAQKLDTQYRRHLHASEILRASRNTLTKDQLAQGKKLKTELKQIESEADKTKSQLEEILNQIPNLPRPEAPLGKNETENVEVRKWGVPRKFDFQPKDHLELGKYLNILDFVTGAKVVGSQFYYWYGDGALLELALVRFTFDLLQKEGFLPVITPDLATAEVTLAGKHADEIIPVQNLPIKYIGYSHCFRQEQGAYGKSSKGLYRVHQFTKAEMFIYCTPEESDKYHLHILDMEEKIYQALGLPYRVF